MIYRERLRSSPEAEEVVAARIFQRLYSMLPVIGAGASTDDMVCRYAEPYCVRAEVDGPLNLLCKPTRADDGPCTGIVLGHVCTGDGCAEYLCCVRSPSSSEHLYVIVNEAFLRRALESFDAPGRSTPLAREAMMHVITPSSAPSPDTVCAATHGSGDSRNNNDDQYEFASDPGVSRDEYL